jgi:flagellar biosynthetic protein FliO
MELLQQLASAAAVIALFAACLWWLRRRGMAAVWRPRRAAGRRLQTVERLPLGPQHTLHLIRMGERALIVACSPGGCCLLAERAWHEIAAAGAAVSGETCGG